MWPLLLHWPANTQVLLALGSTCCETLQGALLLKEKKPTIYSLYSTRLEVIILGGKAPALPSSLPSMWTSLLPHHFSSPCHSAIPTPKMLPNSRKCQRPAGISGPFHILLPLPAPASRAIPAQCPTLPAPPATLLQCPPRAGSVALSLGSSFQPSWLPNIPFPAFSAF